MKPKIILSHPFTPDQVEQLRGQCDLILGDDYSSLQEAAQAHAHAIGLISFLSDRIDESLMAVLPNLKIIANYAVGYNNIDVAAAWKRGIWVSNTPDVLTEATADLTMVLLLAAARRLIESDRFMRSGQFQGWGANLLLGKELRGGTLGIVGLGRIGSAVAERAKAFGLKLIHYSPSSKPETEARLGITRVTLEELIEQSDIISLHLPYSPEVHHLFDAKAFARMKPGAIFINVSRGKLMDEAALLEAVQSNHLFAAGLDVYEDEPHMTPGLEKCERIVLAPHIGSATTTTRARMAEMVIENVMRAIAGQRPPHAVKECG